MSRARRCGFAVLLAMLVMPESSGAQTPSPGVDPVIQKLGEYVASYGEKASLIVAVEKYTQTVSTPETAPMRPRRIEAEFAIVRADGAWVGFRDVVEVNGEAVSDRRDRLQTLLAEPSGLSEAMRIANESARYNIGPVTTNMNVPTTALLFFQPANLARFTFTRKGSKKIEGTQAVEFDFRETQVPTLVSTRAGKDVPLEGTLWVVPEDGTVVRTRLRLRGFADDTATVVQQAPPVRAPVNPNAPTGGREALAASRSVGSNIDPTQIRSVADIEVTYARNAELGLWLPAKMAELYEGAIKIGARPPFQGMSTTRATYSNFRQFGTGATIRTPK